MLSAENIEQLTIDPDTPFQFKCRSCGKCCKDRHDIILKPRDLFRIAQYLNKDTNYVMQRYCHISIGPSSKLPIITLKAVGPAAQCPFLQKRRCAIHGVKPEVCALYPLGRYTNSKEGQYSIYYLLQPTDCGGVSKTYTVRSWLSQFDLPVDDPFYLQFTQICMDLTRTMHALIKQRTQEEQFPFTSMIFQKLYHEYQMDQPFDHQFEVNMSSLTDEIDRLVREGLIVDGQK